ncbi:MAG TPA: phage holin family protein [Thermoanaerobaculia bacterium]|nr:phage holin family protein [Thermoanaerobaculia bacterium]
MPGFIARWILNTLALLLISWIVPGIHATSIVALAIAAAVLGLLNAVVKPILFWLTLPLTILTLGLFLIVLNAIMLGLTAFLVPGFSVDGFWPAAIGGIILGILSLFINRVGRDDS